jgi:type IV pilus assembly protein PilY1
MVAACLATLAGLPVNAAVVLPNTPLQSGSRVPPNVMFILDDSGSMTDTVMDEPTVLISDTTGGGNINSTSYIGNTLYYNPHTTYRPWRNADGSYMADATYDSAWGDADLTSNAVNLGSNTRTFYEPIVAGTVADTKDYYRYRFLTNGTADRCERTFSGGSWGWRNCVAVNSFTWSTDVGPVTRDLATEKVNFANWYAFHRTRIKAAKAGAGNAFAELGENLRVGFDTIWNRNFYGIPVGSDGGLFRDAAPSTNRTTWYSRLYASRGSGNTPLQAALIRTGNYFKQTGANGPWGPEAVPDQVTCRQNFAILTTDGYWNNGIGPNNADNTDGAVITGPNGASYQYTPGPPYAAAASGSLADAAMDYWKTDLRQDASMVNNVPISGADPAFWQHMVTFGLSIGLRGTLDPKNDLVRAGPNNDLTDGGLAWPDPVSPNQETPRRIDDLWHAAVNGHGSFVAASSPEEFTKGLKDALAAIVERTGSSSNVSVNGTRVGTNTQVFQGSFVSGKWTGELKAYPVTTNGVGTTPTWAASGLIPTAASRNIFTFNGTSGSTFTWAGLTGAQRTALGSSAVLDYLRGSAANEVKNGGTYRDRTTVLGDIDHSSPVYVDTDPDGNPSTNDGHRTVYAGANDGMLHAFDAATGVEEFAYVPASISFGQLAGMTAVDYPHNYFVDGEIAVSTRKQTPGKNILVGLLGRGGKSIYALDVSDPTNFTASDVLWEFSDPDLGNALGEPIITKLNNGKTGVIFGNGYNSNSGHSVLFILDIEDGSIIKKFDTGAGDTGANPNGLASPRGWDANRSGTFDFIYAGDLLGNVWKFNINDTTSTGNWAIALAGSPLFVARNSGGTRQPITAGMSIGLNPNTFQRWIFFGTGRYLTSGDPTDRGQQGWYGVLDDGSNVAVARSDLVQRSVVLNTSADGRAVRAFEAPVAGDMTGKKGWVVDLPTPANPNEGGERIVTRSDFNGSVLLAASIIPSSDACSTGGRGYVNFIDPFTGGSLPTSYFDSNGNGVADDVIGPDNLAIGSADLGVGMPTMPTVIQNGPKGHELIIVGSGTGGAPPGLPGLSSGSWGRTSWREILRD